MLSTKTRILSMINSETILVAYKDSLVLEIQDAIDDYILFDKLTNGKRVKRLLILGENMRITKEARSFFEFEERKRKEQILCEAIVVNSIFKEISVYLSQFLKRKSYATRVFRDIKTAKQWLQKK